MAMNDPTNQGIGIVLQTLLQQQRDMDAKIDRLGNKLDERLALYVTRDSFDGFRRDFFDPLRTDVEGIVSNKLPKWFWTAILSCGPVVGAICGVIASHLVGTYWK